jgi:hypothetical protein
MASSQNGKVRNHSKYNETTAERQFHGMPQVTHEFGARSNPSLQLEAQGNQ